MERSNTSRAGGSGKLPQLGQLADLPPVLLGERPKGLGLARQRAELRQGAPIPVERLDCQAPGDRLVHECTEFLLPDLLESCYRVQALGEVDELLEHPLVGPKGAAGKDEVAHVAVGVSRLANPAHLEIVLGDPRLTELLPSLEGPPEPIVQVLLELAHA
jgi:hypothetical protein